MVQTNGLNLCDLQSRNNCNSSQKYEQELYEDQITNYYLITNMLENDLN